MTIPPLLISFLFTLQVGGAEVVSLTPPAHDWGVAYYMSYDNSLDGYGAGILEQIRNGAVSSRVIAAVQADFVDAKGMRRYTVTPAGIHKRMVASEDSADEDQAIAFLRWFVTNFPCRKYVIVFLNHGGKVDQMCSDRHPATPGKTWMSGHVLAEKLRAFIAQHDLKVELLFLQQCGRGSIENLFSFRGTAAYVMSSPMVVGAPNTYYTALHQWLDPHPEAKGDAVARRIAQEDRDFELYTCVRGECLAEMGPRLDRVLRPFLQAETLRAPKLPPVIFSEGNESIVDLCVYLNALARENEIGLTQTEAFYGWLERTLLTDRYVRDGRSDAVKSLCGFSLFVPAEPEAVDRYAYLDLYGDTALQALWQRLYGDGFAD